MNTHLPTSRGGGAVYATPTLHLLIGLLLLLSAGIQAQSFGESSLDFNGEGDVAGGTSLMFGPDKRLYVLGIKGTVDVFSIQRNGPNDYVVTGSEELLDVKNIPNHNDDGSANGNNNREATGLTVAGTAANPVIYVTSSDSRIGGPSGDQNLDTNSGVITRLSWTGSDWVVVDIVRGLSRSEENHATNGLEFVTVGATDYLIVCSGGHTNAGSPSDNFAWTTEYALSAAILSVNLSQLETFQVLTDPSSGRKYIYDLPTLDDPTRANVSGITDPDAAGYTGVDLGDPWGGNDGMNQAMLVEGGPVQIFAAGFRNSFDLVVTADGKVYCTDNGANGGWGGLPVNEGTDGTVTNEYLSSEPGSSSSVGGEQVNNADHLTLITNNIQTYPLGEFYGGHPTPIRANPAGAGLYTNPTVNANTNAVFRTLRYDPDGSRGAGYTPDVSIALPANWPPVPLGQADARQGDWRGPGISNPDGPDDILVTTWGTNTNGIDEYTASNFGGDMQGDLLAGKNGGVLRRVQLKADGSLQQLTNSFISNLGGNPLGITCNSDADIFPGTVWIATFNNTVKVLEPQDFKPCVLPGEPGYTTTGDSDADGYTNQDEIDNKAGAQTVKDVICNAANQPDDFDKPAGGTLVSDLNDPDDDNDGILDANDPYQLGDPTDDGSDAFLLPVRNDLMSDDPTLKGYLGLGFTGLMNDGATGPNWLNSLDRRDDPADPNPNDILGGAVGAMTMQMTSGTALGSSNSQEKAFQYGVDVDQTSGTFTVEGRLFNFSAPLQLYGNTATPNGELGLYIGDGTQRNYLKFVLTAGGQLQARQEINDVPQTLLTTAVSAAQDIVLSFRIDAATGFVSLLYATDGGSTQQLGGITAQGNILAAIKNPDTPLAVGLIGTSNTPGQEVEGNWDYLYVHGTHPFVEQPLPNVAVLVGAADLTIDLEDYFGDASGEASGDDNLTYTVSALTNTAIGASIGGTTLTLSFPTTNAEAQVTIRATDTDGFFVDQSFQVTVSDEPVPILRLRASGPVIAATDAPYPDWLGSVNTGAQSGTFNSLTYAVNTGSFSAHNIMGRHASLPAYVPQALFANERWDPAGAPEMEWTFGLPDGEYFIRLYLGNGFSGTSAVGQRQFDVSIEGQIVQTDLDLVARFGHQAGGMLEYPVTLTDGTLNLQFIHKAENHPLINGIEILAAGGNPPPPIAVTPIPDQHNQEGDLINLTVLAMGGDAGANFSFGATGLPPGTQIEPTTGLVFGTIAPGASAGSVYNSVVTVSKPGSNALDVPFTWTVTDPVAAVNWNDQSDDENYTARHECSFVQAGDKFYLFGGRENSSTLDVYDYQAKTWSQIANSAPAEFNHFQAVEYQGLIWVIGAFKNNSFPDETPADFVWSYNPATDEWVQGPAIPNGRKRGSAGLVVHNGKFYIIAGNTIGHNGGYIPWFDEFDPATGVWTALGDAPRARDHFHAGVIGNKLYVAGGRLSGGPQGTFAPLIAEVDVYDFTTGNWSVAPELPTPRAAASVVPFKGELYVIGGEIGVDLQGEPVNDAVNTTEAFNPVAGTWSTRPGLLTERHGTQAIVSGDGIHVAAGSNTQGGGGKMKNMEYFGTDNPVGTPLTASQLQTPASADINSGGTSDIFINTAGGNTAIIITSVTIEGPDAASFYLETPVEFALLKAGTGMHVTVGFSGGDGGKAATLTIGYGKAGTATIVLNGTVVAPGTVLYRINTGGSLTPTNDADPTDWAADQSVATTTGTAATGTPSPYYNTTPPAQDATNGADFTGSNATGYPSTLFSTERFSTVANPNNMQYDFPVEDGEYTVNLLFAETWTGAQAPGTRVFDVLVEGELALDNFDQTVAYGWNTAGVESITVIVDDGNLDIDFIKGPQNPNIKGIEIISGSTLSHNVAPLVSNPGAQLGVEGDNVSLQIDATDTDPCSGLTYTASGLPTGLTIDPNSGLISGTLALATGSGTAGAAAGSPYDVVVTVSDGCTPAVSTQMSFDWEVVDRQASSLTVTASSQGRDDASGVHTLALYAPSDLTTPRYTYTPTADNDGRMTVAGYVSGTYVIVLRRTGYLRRVQQRSLTTAGATTTFAELRAGDLDADNRVSILDYSLLANAFGQTGQPSDFNGDGSTGILDFSLLASNFNRAGDPLVADN